MINNMSFICFFQTANSANNLLNHYDHPLSKFSIYLDNAELYYYSNILFGFLQVHLVHHIINLQQVKY